MDGADALDAMRRPRFWSFGRNGPRGPMAKAGLAGEFIVASMKAAGCIGMLSNGPSRDADAIRRTARCGVYPSHSKGGGQ